jgi:glucose 1-dehydrogenase
MQLEGKVALITGSDSGIGQAIAEAFAREGADIVVNYRRDQAGAEETARRVKAAGRRAIVVQADVGMPEQVQQMFDTLLKEFGKIDIMVNNAAHGGGYHLADLSFEEWERVIRTNIHGSFLCSKLAAADMVQRGQGGKIIMISSVHEEAPGVGGIPYHVSKGGIRNLTRALALDLAPYKINVNDIAPGMIASGGNLKVFADPEERARREALVPWGRAGEPSDIANMAVFLASDASDYCTGSTFFVDGGWMLTWPPV